MRTTLNLDDNLATRAKLSAVRRGTRLTVLMKEGLQQILSASPADFVVLCSGGSGAPEGFPWDKSEAGMVEFLEGETLCAPR